MTSEIEINRDLNSNEEVKHQPQEHQSGEIKDNEHYTGDGKTTQQGWIFQLQLSMLFLWRATNNESIERFRLASEYGQAKSLDDLVFQYKTGGTCKLRLLQAKHRKSENISWKDLKSNGDQFSLSKYFHSFLKVKRLCSLKSHYTMLSDTHEIEDLLLVTSGNITDDAKSKLSEDSEAVSKDSMLQVDQKVFRETTCFKIKPNDDMSAAFEVSSDLYNLVNYIARRISEKQEPTSKITEEDKIFVDYYYPLMKYVFEVSDDKSIKFRDSFLDDTQDNQHCINPFRQKLIDKISDCDSLKKFRDQLSNKLLKKNVPLGDLTDVEKFANQLGKMILTQPNESHSELCIDKKATKIVKTNIPKCIGYVFVKCYDKVRFNTFFLDDKQSENLPEQFKTFRSKLKLILEQNFSNLSCLEVKITFKELHIPGENLFNIDLPVDFSSEDVEEFKSKFKLIVNYPDREQLMKVINGCTGKELFRSSTEVFNAFFYQKMHHWLADTAGTFYTKAEAQKLFSDLKDTLKIWSVEFTNKQFFTLNVKTSLEFENYDTVSNFLGNESKVLRINCMKLICDRIRIGQTINALQKNSNDLEQYILTDKYICIEKDDPEILPIIETNFNLIIIDCSRSSNDFIQSVLSRFPDKKVILLSDVNNSQVEMKKELDNNFLSLKAGSREYLLAEKLIKVRGIDACSLHDIFGDNINKFPHVINHVFYQYLENKLILIESYTFSDIVQSTVALERFYYKYHNKSSKLFHHHALLEFNEENLIVISGVAGMGKSTALLKLFEVIKDSERFVILINLADYCDVLEKKQTQEKKKKEKAWNLPGWSLHFLLYKLCKKLTSFEKDVLIEVFSVRKLESNLFVLIDGFDDICPDFCDVVLEFVNDLRSFAKKIFISARTSVENHLERLSPVIYHLTPLSPKCQRSYLENVWSELTSTEKSKLFDRINPFLVHSFYSIPLYLSMLVQYMSCDTNVTNLSQNDLFKLFVSSCIARYYERIGLTGSNMEQEKMRLNNTEQSMNDYKILAMSKFGTFLQKFKTRDRFEELQKQFKDGTELRHGLVKGFDERPVFVHERFAEYFVALWFVDTFKKLDENTTGRTKTKQNWFNHNLLKILTYPEHEGIRTFLYSYLDKVFTEPWLNLIELTKNYDEQLEFIGKNLVQQIVWDRQTDDTEKSTQLKRLEKTFKDYSVEFFKRLINKASLDEAIERNLEETKEILKRLGPRNLAEIVRYYE